MSEFTSALKRARQWYNDANRAYQQAKETTDWNFTRPLLMGQVLDNNPYHSYEGSLPTLNGQNFITLVDGRVALWKEKQRQGISSEKIVIMDVGFGNGTAALGMVERWGEAVQVVCYGDTSLPEKAGISSRAPTPLIEEIVQHDNITLVEGNIVDIHRKVRQRLGDKFRADFIVSSWAVGYIPYPHFQILKHLYSLLKPEGILLANKFYLHFDKKSDEKSLQEYLQSEGYICEVGNTLYQPDSVALKKNYAHLPNNLKVRRRTGSKKFEVFTKNP